MVFTSLYELSQKIRISTVLYDFTGFNIVAIQKNK